MIQVIKADITILALDAIVNAANESLLGGGGVDGAIHRVAGPELYAACAAIGGCPTGEARITPGFNLPCKWVIHAVGPRWRGGRSGEHDLLESCYLSAFQVAQKYDVRMIAFPCISTGIFGFPKPAAAQIAVAVMRRYEERFDKIVCCCFGEEEKLIYEQTLEESIA